jgi:hypothetical protein
MTEAAPAAPPGSIFEGADRDLIGAWFENFIARRVGRRTVWRDFVFGSIVMSPAERGLEYFEAAKTISPIPIVAPLVREALIQFSLDPAVRAIDLMPQLPVRSDDEIRGIILVGETSRALLDFPELAPARQSDDRALTLLPQHENGPPVIRRVTAAALRREPRAGNCRMVWACRHRRVVVDDRIRVLELLNEEGPLPLTRVAGEMCFARGVISAVLAMACADLVEIELERAPLGPKTVVRMRAPLREEG